MILSHLLTRTHNASSRIKRCENIMSTVFISSLNEWDVKCAPGNESWELRVMRMGNGDGN